MASWSYAKNKGHKMSPMYDIFVQHLEQSGVSDRSVLDG
ncbi:hypothetical protein C1A50_0488 [Paenibacillus polymyxa]|nr:hypothetical protein C1A50_0488 [Paenibacillus polymyxa]